MLNVMEEKHHRLEYGDTGSETVCSVMNLLYGRSCPLSGPQMHRKILDVPVISDMVCDIELYI